MSSGTVGRGVDINLRVDAGHVRKMPLLTELGDLFFVWSLLQRWRIYGAVYFTPKTMTKKIIKLFPPI